MKRRLLLGIAIACALAACTGDDGSPSPTIDAPTTIDAPSNIDAPPSTMCTGAAYDPCTAPNQCMSGNCRAFMQAGIQVCTQSCDANNPCPMQNGQAVPCNNMGLCRPNAANSCTR